MFGEDPDLRIDHLILVRTSCPSMPLRPDASARPQRRPGRSTSPYRTLVIGPDRGGLSSRFPMN